MSTLEALENNPFGDLEELLNNEDEQTRLMTALDSIDPNPHGNAFEVDDRDIETLFLDYNETQNEHAYKDLTDYPDYSDLVYNDYMMNYLRGIDQPQPDFIDLDTAPDYVQFVNNSVKNMLDFENLFNDQTVYQQIGQSFASKLQRIDGDE